MCGGTIDETIEISGKIFLGGVRFQSCAGQTHRACTGRTGYIQHLGQTCAKTLCIAKHRLVRVRRKKRNSKSGLGERCGPSLRANPFAAIGSKKQPRIDCPGIILDGKRGWGLEEGLWLYTHLAGSPWGTHDKFKTVV